MKKKILFVLNCMGAGGIAKSLSNLLFYMEKYKEDYEVDLFLFKKQGCYIVHPAYVWQSYWIPRHLGKRINLPYRNIPVNAGKNYKGGKAYGGNGGKG